MSLPRQNNPWKRLLDFDGNSSSFSSKQLSCALAIGPLSFFLHHLLMQSKAWAKLPQDTPSLSFSLSSCASCLLGVPFLSTTGLVVSLWADSSAFLSFSSLFVAFKGHLFAGPFSLKVVSAGCSSLKMSSSVQSPISQKRKKENSQHVCQVNTKTECHCEYFMLLDHKPCGPNNFFQKIGFLNISYFLIPLSSLVSFKLCPTMFLL